jgi:predicted nucleic acid-binding protein
MRVVDSSAWIEWLGRGRLVGRLRPMMPGWGSRVVPTVVQLEVAKWLKREVSERSADAFIGHSQMCIVAPLTTDIAVRAAELCITHKLATADAIIYATALHMDADLLTCDAHFKDLPGVVYLDKEG